MKILVVGFPRSGTSLTHRIFKKHPEIKRMFFEKFMIKNCSKRELIKSEKVFSPGVGCGEKIIYTRRRVKKDGSMSVVDYCKKWNKFFGKEARIIQPIRHPFDSWTSMKKNGVHRKNSEIMERLYNLYFEVVPECTEVIGSFPNCFTFKYENLVMNKDEITKELYSFCNLSDFYFDEKMKKRRVFANKKLPFYRHKKMSEVLNIFNKFDGPKYEEFL